MSFYQFTFPLDASMVIISERTKRMNERNLNIALDLKVNHWQCAINYIIKHALLSSDNCSTANMARGFLL